MNTNSVTLPRADYDKMREDLRVFNAGAVVVHTTYFDGKHRQMYNRVPKEVGDVDQYIGEQLGAELDHLREVVKGYAMARPAPAPAQAKVEAKVHGPRAGLLAFIAGASSGAVIALTVAGVI